MALRRRRNGAGGVGDNRARARWRGRALQKFRGYFIIPPDPNIPAKSRGNFPNSAHKIMHQNRRKPPATTGQSLDKYYTKRDVVRKCLAVVGDLSREYDLVVEPSAGDGAFYDEINHPNKMGIDIDPAHKKVVKADWLKFEVPGEYRRVLVVGNPPFGMYHKLSSAFISHALSFGNVHPPGLICGLTRIVTKKPVIFRSETSMISMCLCSAHPRQKSPCGRNPTTGGIFSKPKFRCRNWLKKSKA